MMERNTRELSPFTPTSGVPKVKVRTGAATPDTRKLGNWIMIACCVPMVIGGGILLYAMGSNASWSARLSTLAPLTLCFGAHFFMHKLIGHACQGSKNTSKNSQGNSNEKNS